MAIMNLLHSISALTVLDDIKDMLHQDSAIHTQM